MPVLAMREVGRGGPQPKTQSTMPNAPGLSTLLAMASAGTGRLALLLWPGLATRARETAGWPSEEPEAGFMPWWLAMLVSWMAKWIANWRIDLLPRQIWLQNGCLPICGRDAMMMIMAMVMMRMIMVEMMTQV